MIARKFLFLALIFLAALSFGACGSSDTLPKSDPSIRGIITNSNIGAGVQQILVEENPDDASGSQKAAIRLKENTKIYRRVGSELGQAGVSELTVGKTVSVWFEGPVAESYPVQAAASVVLIEEDKV